MYIKYIFVGGINTFFGYFITITMIYFGLHYSISVFIATIIGIAFNYKTYGKYVFKKTKSNFLLFLIFYFITYFLNILIIKILSYELDLYISSFIAIMFSSILGFFFNSRYVYREKN